MDRDRSLDGWLYFDIHGLVKLRVAIACSSIGRFRETFGPFACPEPVQADITVSPHADPPTRAARIKWQYRYTAHAVQSMEQRWVARRLPEGFTIGGPGDLLPVALPILDRLLVERGAALVHAAAASLGGQGICLPAAGGTGKTSAVAMLSRLEGAAFMADDFALITGSGRLLAFPKRIWMKSHHRRLYDRGFRLERRRALPYRFSQQRIAPLVLPLMRSYPKVRELVKRHSPVLMAVPTAPSEALGVAIATSAPLRCLLFLESYEAPGPEVRVLQPDLAASRLVGQFYSDVLRESQPVVAVLAATGLVPIDRQLHEKSEVVRRGLAGTPAFLLRLPAGLPREQAGRMVVEQVIGLLDHESPAGRTPSDPGGRLVVAKGGAAAGEEIGLPGPGHAQ